MKKSFMTRALATGLSLAMAFSLSAATNVTTAEAASLMKASSKTVTEGKTVKAYMTSSMAKKYRIKSHKESTVAKKYISVAMMSSRKGLKITAKEGALAAANLEKKGVKVKINFVKASSAKAAKKATKIAKTANLKVVVKAKPVDKLTMTAEATKANEIVAKFNKAIASDSKITLKKGAADVANKAVVAEDGMSATITLTGKLSDGTYTVTVVAGEDTVTADVVAKNEVLTSFEIGTTVKEVEKKDDKATAVLSYKALNQYGDKINYTPDVNAVTISIGKVDKVTACKTSGAGEITIKEIPSMYAIPGQSFTAVIVDTVNNTGVTLNKTAVYGASATATEFTAAGVYSVNKSAFKDVADGDKINNNFYLLFTAKDQYGDDMDAKKVATLASDGAIQVTVAGGLTNIKAKDLKGETLDSMQKEIGGVNYFAVPLAKSGTEEKANAGNYTVTIVNNTKGIVYTGDYTVTSGVVIASVQISPKDTIYANQDNEFDYTVVDTDGKEVTDYATLKNIKIEGNYSNNSKNETAAFSWKQNTNGTGKLVYKPLAFEGLDDTSSARDFTKSEIRSCTIKANKEVSGKYLVKSQTFAVYVQRQAVSVTGLASSADTVTTNGNLDVKLEKLIILDQYQNPYSEGDLKGNTTIGAQVKIVSDSALNNATIKDKDLSSGDQEFGTKITLENITSTVTPTKLHLYVQSDAAVATNAIKNGNDCTLSFYAGDAQKVGGLYIDKVNDGCALQGDGVTAPVFLAGKTDAAKSESDEFTNVGVVVVKGTVNGKTVEIAPSQFSFVGADKYGYLKLDGVQSYALAQKVITETREFKIVVSTEDGPQTITGTVEVSNAPAVATTISAEDVTTTFNIASPAANGKVYTAVSADGLFKIKTQYNTVVTGCALLTYAVESVTVEGASLKYDGETKTDGATIPVSVLKPYLNGSNMNYITLDTSNITDVQTGTKLVAKVSVEGAVAGTSNTASKTITLNIDL